MVGLASSVEVVGATFNAFSVSKVDRNCLALFVAANLAEKGGEKERDCIRP